MNIQTSALLFCSLFITNLAQANPISLLDAIQSKEIGALITGNENANNPANNSHTGKCVKMILTNHGKLPKQFLLENGSHFTNLRTPAQDLIVSEQLICSVAPNASATFFINAFCGEKTQSAPSVTDTFQLAYTHQGSIRKLTQFIEKKKLYCYTGQVAIWCFTDNDDLSNIYDTYDDIKIENELVKLVAEEKKIPIPNRIINHTPHQPRILRYPLESEGKFKKHIEQPTSLGIYLTDSTHHPIETIIAEETESRSGTVTLSYFIRTHYPKGVYYIEAKVNNTFETIHVFNLGEDPR